MILSKSLIEKIKKIIENNYRALAIQVVGARAFSEDELKRLKEIGLDVEDKASLLSLVYYHNVLNNLVDAAGPVTVDGMLSQQKAVPPTEDQLLVEEQINENFLQLIDKLRTSTQSNIEGLIRNYNLTQINNSGREQSVNKLKQSLRDYSKDATRDWSRVAVTETANAIGLGSVERVATQNKDKEPNEIYVYRIPVNDAALCKYCREFYLDEDGSPSVYRLSTLLSNGTNYGKKAVDWRPVAGPTHPNDRESGVIELKPGWRVLPEGRIEYMGLDSWLSYITDKLKN